MLGQKVKYWLGLSIQNFTNNLVMVINSLGNNQTQGWNQPSQVAQRLGCPPGAEWKASGSPPVSTCPEHRRNSGQMWAILPFLHFLRATLFCSHTCVCITAHSWYVCMFYCPPLLCAHALLLTPAVCACLILLTPTVCAYFTAQSCWIRKLY